MQTEMQFNRPPASWVIVERRRGVAVQEVMRKTKPRLAPVMALAYEVVPIREWLERVNRAAGGAA